jgi:hypothetical protein
MWWGLPKVTTQISKWRINTSLYYRLLLLTIFCVVTLIFSSCSMSTVRLNTNDSQALQNVYEESNWTFHPSSVTVQVNKGGAVKLSIVGDATEKISDGNKPVWIPVALLEELPEYFETSGENSTGVKLISYKVKGGLWSIVALIPEADNTLQIEKATKIEKISTKSNSGKQNKTQTRRISLDVLMISPVFDQSLPFNLPVAQSLASIKTSIELPTKARFTSLLARGNGESAKLTELPLSLSEGKVKAIAKLQPELADIWDFSGVGYQLPGDNFSRLLLLKYAWWTSLLCLIVIAVWIGWEIWANKQLMRHLGYYSEGREIDYLEDQVQGLISHLRRNPEREDGETYFLAERIQGLMRRLRYYPEGREIYYLEEQVQELVSRLRRSSEREDRETYFLVERIQELMRRLRYYPERLEYRERSEYRKKQRRFLFYTTVAIVAIIALALFISSVALSKETNEKPKNNATKTSLLLGDFNYKIDSSDYSSGKVKATLSFLPLSSQLEVDGKSQLEIEFTGNNIKLVGQNNIPDTIKLNLQPDNPSLPQKFLIRNIPTKTLSDLGPLVAASKGGIQIDQYAGIAEVYNQALKTEPKPAFIEMEYEISGALTRKEQIPDKYFSWFPVDKSLLAMPIKVKGATAIISQISVETPLDLYSHVKQSGIEQLDSNFKRAESQVNKYILTPGANKFIVINSENEVLITGNYERNFPGKVFLTWGVALIGGIIGLIVGFCSSSWKSLWQGIATIAGGSLIAFIATVAINKDFQSIVSLRGQISFFDIFLLLGLISLVGTSILMFQSKNSLLPPLSQKKYLISTFVFSGVLSVIIPTLLAMFVHP